LKVPWSRGPGTKEVQKSRDLKSGKVPGQWKPYQDLSGIQKQNDGNGKYKLKQSPNFYTFTSKD
jgi:hypothetical protein